MRRAGRQAEHQQRLRPVSCQQLRQFAVDGLIGDRKDVARQFDVVERRTAQSQQPRHQRLRRIEGRAGKRTET